MEFKISSRTSARVLVFISFILIPYCASRKGCTFRHNGCMYNIHLNDPDNSNRESVKNEMGCGHRQYVNLDRAQNDYTAKIDDMEKNFSFLKDKHENRIKELESTVKELLGLDEFPTEKRGELEVVKNQWGLGSYSFNNIELMDKLQLEFEKLRDEVRTKTEDLLDTKTKLNKTEEKMHEAHLKHFQSRQDLLDAENQISVLRRERMILKNQLKDRGYKLEVAGKKARECEKKSVGDQDKIMKLFRKESTVSEELMTTKLILNKTIEEKKQCDSKYADIKSRNGRTRSVLRIREKELIQCYAAKTSTFCGFEDPLLCGFSNIKDASDFFDWTRAKGKTPSSGTGPSKDHTCDAPTGHFMFIEASAKGRGSNAILYSPLYRGMDVQCVEFFYHMNGKHIGTLNVYAQARGDALQAAWRAYGNQGDVWTSARLSIPKELAMAGYQIAFEGITERGYQGDIAIDDVSVTDGACPIDETVVPIAVNVTSESVLKKGNNFAKKLQRRLMRAKKKKN